MIFAIHLTANGVFSPAFLGEIILQIHLEATGAFLTQTSGGDARLVAYFPGKNQVWTVFQKHQRLPSGLCGYLGFKGHISRQGYEASKVDSV
jgi:hypothetical protein